MKGNILESIVGAVVLVVAAVFVYFVCVSEVWRGDHGYVLHALFDDAGGLTVGSDVKVSGIKVGVVKSLRIDKNYQANVALLIRSDVNFPNDSSAEIATDGLLGSKFVAINVGFAKEQYAQGDTIDFTKSGLSIEKLINQFIVGGNKKVSSDK